MEFYSIISVLYVENEMKTGGAYLTWWLPIGNEEIEKEVITTVLGVKRNPEAKQYGCWRAGFVGSRFRAK